MAAFCLLALIIGGLSATALPLVAFCAALLLALVLGSLAAFIISGPGWGVVAGAIALFSCAQIGYGLGLAFCSRIGHPIRINTAVDFRRPKTPSKS